jgi:hypothetical protein
VGELTEDAYSLFYARDGGPNPAMHEAAPAILRWLRALTQGAFVCDAFSLANDDHLVLLPPALIDPRKPDTAHHRVTFHRTLVEWSLDALGWTAAFLAHLSSRHGVCTPLMLTAATHANGAVHRVRAVRTPAAAARAAREHVGSVSLGHGGLALPFDVIFDNGVRWEFEVGRANTGGARPGRAAAAWIASRRWRDWRAA